MGFLSNLFKKGQSITKNSLSQCIAEFISRPQSGETYSKHVAVENYRSWVYTCATLNSKNVADSEIKLFSNKKPQASQFKTLTKKEYKDITSYGIRTNRDVVEINFHPILDLLLQPNSEDSFYTFFYKINLFLELMGEGYVLIERNNRGIPAQLWVLFSQYVTKEVNANGEIIKYHYGIKSNGSPQYSYLPDDIIYFKLFDPEEIHDGIGPYKACHDSNQLISSMNLNEQSLNRNLSVPSGILTYKNEQIKTKDRDLIEKKWQEKFAGSTRQGKIVVTGKDVTYDAIGITPRDMMFIEGRNWSRSEIFACFGVPPALILTEDVNRSNMFTSQTNYYHNTIKPRCKLISQTLTNQLIKRNGLSDNAFVVINKQAPQDVDYILEKTKILTTNSAITVNELRTELGYDIIDNGDELVISNNNNRGEDNA